MTKQAQQFEDPIDTAKPSFPETMVGCRGSLDLLTEIALQSGIAKEDIYRALAENLVIQSIGFAILKLSAEGDRLWVEALFDAEGTHHSPTCPTEYDEQVIVSEMEADFSCLKGLDPGQSLLMRSIHDLLGAAGEEHLLRLLQVFDHLPLIASRLWHRDAQTYYLLLFGADLDAGWMPEAEWLAEKVGQALEIVDLQARLSVLEAKHEWLFHSARSGYLIIDADGQIEHANSAITRILSMDQEGLVGKDLPDVLPECDHWPGKQGSLAKAEETGKLEIEHRAPDGRIRYLLLEYHTIAAKGNGSFLIQISDLSERWRLEEMVRRLGELKDGMAKHLSVGMILQDPHGFFAHVNEGAANMLGYAVEELLGEHWEMILPQDQQIIFRQATLRRMAGESNRYEMQLQHKTGKRVDVLISESPYQENGQHAGTFTFVTDLSDLRQAEAKILHQNRELQRALERLASLNQAASGALNAIDMETVIAKVGEELGQLGMACLIATLEPELPEWVVQYASVPLQIIDHAQQASETVDLARLPADLKDPWILLLQSGETLFVEDAGAAVQGLTSHGGPFEIHLKGYEWHPRLLAPLSTGSRLSGLLVVCGENLTAEDVPIVTAFANHLSFALEKARLSASTLTQAKLGQILAELAAAANKESDTTKLLETAGKMILSALGLPFAFFSHYDSQKTSIQVLASVASEEGGPGKGHPQPGTHFHLEAYPVLSKVLATGQVTCNRLPFSESGVAEEGSASPRPAILVPMLVSGRVIGVAIFSSRETEKQLDEDELTFLRIAVEQISVAYERARLTAEAERKVQIDHSFAALVEQTLARRDVEEVVRAAMRGVLDLMPSHFVCITKFDLEGGIAEVLGVMGSNGGEQRKGMQLPLEMWEEKGEAVSHWSGHDGCIGLSSIYNSFQRGLKSWLTAQLRFEGEAFGMLVVASKEEDAFGADHVLLAKRFADHLAVALTNAINLENARKRTEELEALFDLALEISSELDLPALFRIALSRTTQLLDATMGALFLVDEATQEMVLVGEHHLPPAPSPTRLKPGQGLAGKLWKEAKAISIAKTSDLGDPRWLEACYSKGAALGVPLQSDGRIKGALLVYDPAKGQGFHSDEMHLLERMAAQITLGIENIERHEQIARRANQLRVVSDLARRIGTVLEQRQLFYDVVCRVAQSLNIELVAIFIREGNELLEAATYSLPTDSYGDWEPVRLEIGKGGILGLVASEGKPYLVPHVEKEARYIRVLPPEENIQSALAIPLKLKGRVIGVFFAGCEKPAALDPTDLDAMQALGAHISTAMENARLYQEEKRIQSKLLETEKLRSLGMMTSGITHDFNNMLSVIMARTELALSQIGNEKTRRHLEQVLASARDAGETIHRLQDFAHTRPDSADFIELDLNQVAREAIEISRPRWQDQSQKEGIGIEVVEDLRAVKTIEGASVQLREALVNLIFNAVDAMPEGGSIKIGTWTSETGAFLEVSDTGAGMTSEVKEQAFVPFFTTKAGGIGLGLSMVYGAVQRHGGTINIDSEPGHGTSIAIWLPAGHAPSAAEEHGTTSGASVKGRPLTILIVEDENPIRESMVEAFMLTGHHVLSASDGMEGLERFLEADEVDIVFTDLDLPKLSGWQLIAEMRNLDDCLPIVVLSGWGEKVDPLMVLRYAVSKVIAKPLEGSRLQAILTEVMNTNKESPDIKS